MNLLNRDREEKRLKEILLAVVRPYSDDFKVLNRERENKFEKGEEMSISMAIKEIRTILEEAKAEERKRCLEAIKEIVMELRVMFPKECFTHKQEPCSCYDREKGNNDMIIRILEALTTAEESIRKLPTKQ